MLTVSTSWCGVNQQVFDRFQFEGVNGGSYVIWVQRKRNCDFQAKDLPTAGFFFSYTPWSYTHILWFLLNAKRNHSLSILQPCAYWILFPPKSRDYDCQSSSIFVWLVYESDIGEESLCLIFLIPRQIRIVLWYQSWYFFISNIFRLPYILH